MKLKYYLRGLGIGIIVTTLIMMFISSQKEATLSDEEIIARASQLGMVMQEDIRQDSPDMDGADPAEGEPGDSQQESGVAADGVQGENPEENPAGNPEGNPVEDPSGQQTELTDGGVQEMPVDEQEGSNVPQEGTYRLIINHGDVCRTVCVALAENGVIEDSEALRKYLMETGYANSMGPGEYDIPYGLTMEETAQVLMAGPVVRY